MDRGNFGYILGGKLKVKLHEKDELTKQYDVALKILKTKVDKEEHLAETEENIKGTCYLEQFGDRFLVHTTPAKNSFG